MQEVKEQKEVDEVNELLYSGCQVCHAVKPEPSQAPRAPPLLNLLPIESERIKLCDPGRRHFLPFNVPPSVHKVQS